VPGAALKQKGTSLRGDVDRDGRPDRVSLVRVRPGRAHCGAVLVVRTRSLALTLPLGTAPMPGVPAMNGLAAVGGGQRLAIVVTTRHGASTEFAQLFAVRGGHIALVSTKTAENRIPYEGSVTHIDAVDCTEDGQVVASGWFYREDSFGFFRHFYRVGSDGFELARTQSGSSTSSVPARRFHEFREPQPFPSCMRVRAD
jgi:hypothetical protein